MESAAFLKLDGMDHGFQPMTLLRHDFRVADILFLQSGLEGVARRLIDTGTRFRIGAIRSL